MERPALVRTLPLITALVTLAASSAGAAEPTRLWVETHPHERRADAADDRRALDVDVLAAAVDGDDDLKLRLVRRFVQGSGWRHVVQLHGVDDLADGRRLAAAFAEAGVTGRLVGELDGRVQLLGEEVAAVSGPSPAADPGGPGPAEDPEAGLLRKAVKAHGGPRGGLEILDRSPALRFAFERRLQTDAGVLLAANRFFRQGDAMRLEVDIVEGTGRDSRTVLTADDRARLLEVPAEGEEGGEPVDRDPARTREVLARFGPGEVLAVALGFPRDADRGGPWEGLASAGRVDCGGTRCEVLRLPDAPDAGGAGDPERLVEAWIGRDDHLLRAIEWDTEGGRLRFDLADYREVTRGLVLPFSVTILRDGAEVERVRVLELALEEQLPAELFESP